MKYTTVSINRSEEIYRFGVGIESTAHARVGRKRTSTIGLSGDQEATRLIRIVASCILRDGHGPMKGKKENRDGFSVLEGNESRQLVVG
jgi:hypothetical protein